MSRWLVGREEGREIVEVLGDRDWELLVGIAVGCGVRVKKVGVRSLDPVTYVELIGGLGAVALVIERWGERRRGGQVVDLRPGAAKPVYRDPDVLFGYVVVLLADGRVEVQVKETANRLAEIVDHLMTAFAGSGGEDEEGTVDKVISLLESLTGDDAGLRVERDQPAHGVEGHENSPSE